MDGITVSPFESLPHLAKLSFKQCVFWNSFLRKIHFPSSSSTEFSNLREIHLNSTPFDVNDLIHVFNDQKLGCIRLTNCRLEDEAAERLKEACGDSLIIQTLLP